MTHWTVASPQELTLDEPVTRLDVHLAAGRLNVVGADGPARVEVSRVGRLPVLVDHTDGRLRVRQEHGRGWRDALSRMGRQRVDVSIAVPADVLASLVLVAGPLVASGLHGGTTAEVTAGQITLMGLTGRIVARITSGSVEALGIRGDLDLETVSGEVTLADSAAERLRVHTVSGPITCDLDNPRHTDIQLSTISGKITARVRPDSDLAVRLHTSAGRVTSGFPQVQASRGRGSTASGEGVLGSGDGKLVASATSGSIALLPRPAVDAEPEELP